MVIVKYKHFVCNVGNIILINVGVEEHGKKEDEQVGEKSVYANFSIYNGLLVKFM